MVKEVQQHQLQKEEQELDACLRHKLLRNDPIEEEDQEQKTSADPIYIYI